MSTRLLAVIALLGLFLIATAAPAEAVRSSKQAKTSDKAQKKSREKKTRKGGDTSLRGRFAKIPVPRVKGAGKIRLEWRARGAGDGEPGKLFRPGKLKAKGPSGPTLKQKVLATTKKSLRKQR